MKGDISPTKGCYFLNPRLKPSGPIKLIEGLNYSNKKHINHTANARLFWRNPGSSQTKINGNTHGLLTPSLREHKINADHAPICTRPCRNRYAPSQENEITHTAGHYGMECPGVE